MNVWMFFPETNVFTSFSGHTQHGFMNVFWMFLDVFLRLSKKYTKNFFKNPFTNISI